MINEPRELFNNSYSEEKYKKLNKEIQSEFPEQLDFRIAETPIFIDSSLKIKILNTCNDIINQIVSPDFISKTERAIPEAYKVPNETSRPEFLAIDFAITKNDLSEFEPQLIELQGFASLFGYQSYLSSKYKKHFEISKNYSEYFNRLNTVTYIQEMKEFLLGDIKAENVILLEIFPEKQKTRLDFAISEKLWGIKTVCITKVTKNGKELFYDLNGKSTKIERIYNRVIFDDLERNFKEIKLNFSLKDDLDVKWISHPNWFYRVSKFSLPLFKSKYIPESNYLSDYKEFPTDLENYVLKPLFSFAGAGVKIDVTNEDLTTIIDPENYLLQKKIEYSPCIKDINGELIKCEVRMLFIWPENKPKPKLMINLARLSRGKMIGVDFNKNFDWVGGSSAFFETN